jgi:glycosyltransferase involved in cell wall biosynthesis
VLVLAGEVGDGGLDCHVRALPVPDLVPRITTHVDPRSARALGHLWTNVAVSESVTEAMDRFRPQLVYERYSPFGVATGVTAAARGLRHLLEVNAPLAWEGARFRRQAFGEVAAVLERAAFGAAGGIIAVSRELKDTLVAAGVVAAKIAVVPNGVDPDMFAPVGPAADVGPGAGAVTVGFVGSLKPWHGLAILVEAFRRLAPDTRYHLLIVGDGPEAATIRALAAELPGRVTHIRAVRHEDVPRFLRAMDIAVAPYPRLERFYYSPLKVLEYMATGRAIVASAIGQPRELLRTDETGVLVPPGDVAALAGAIRCLAHDRERRRALGLAAAREAASRHRWIDRAAQIVGLAQAAA